MPVIATISICQSGLVGPIRAARSKYVNLQREDLSSIDRQSHVGTAAGPRNTHPESAKAGNAPTFKLDHSDKAAQCGSRKGRVHQAFDEQDADVAYALGKQLGLKPSTLKTWFNRWRRAEKPSQPKQVNPKGKKDGKAKGG